MKKIVFILISIFLLTGCSVNYNVYINEDLSIKESINIIEDEDFYNIYYKTTRYNALNGVLDNYKNLLTDNNYKSEVIKEENPRVLIEKNYNDIKTFLNTSKFFNDYFDEIKYNEDGNIIKIETVGFNPNEEDNPDRFYVKGLDIAITSAYKVTKSNASNIDTDTNTYHFIMDDASGDFKILLEFDKSVKFNPFLKKIIMIIIAVLIIIATWIGIIIFNKKKKN